MRPQQQVLFKLFQPLSQFSYFDIFLQRRATEGALTNSAIRLSNNISPQRWNSATHPGANRLAGALSVAGLAHADHRERQGPKRRR